MQFLDLGEFVSGGYLQELNRRFLHPLGLALIVEAGADGAFQIKGVQDHRDKPEGLTFQELNRAHIKKINDEWDAKTLARVKLLGYTDLQFHNPPRFNRICEPEVPTPRVSDR